MTCRIGFDLYTIDHRLLSPDASLEFAQSHGLDGVQFLEPALIDPHLDPARLAAFRRRANALHLYLEVGISSPNPIRASRQEGREVAPSELALALAKQVAAASALGCRHVRAFVAGRHDRFRRDTPWPQQIAATAEVLRLLTPTLLEKGLRIALETHADLTVDELLGLLDQLDPAVAGVTLDTGNLLMRLDEPVRAAQRLAPWVLATHVKDCVLAHTPRGLAWQARPVGSGILPLPDILAPLLNANPSLHLTIELHPRTYDLPIHDPSWLAFFPSLRPDSLTPILRLANLSASKFANGSLASPETVEAIPWPQRDLEWLALSLGYLRRVAPILTRIDSP